MSQWLQNERKILEMQNKNTSSPLKRLMAPKKKLTIAAEFLEKLHLSPEELEQFDAEMMAEPLVYIYNGKNGESSIYITEHFLRASFIYRNELDYGIFRLSDIAKTYCAQSKNPSIIKPKGRFYDVYFFDANGKRMGGVSFTKEEDLKTFNAAMETYSPTTRLNVPAEEVKLK